MKNAKQKQRGMKLGKLIDSVRFLPRKQVAAAIGRDEFALSRYCNGHVKPRNEVIQKLATYLDATPYTQNGVLLWRENRRAGA